LKSRQNLITAVFFFNFLLFQGTITIESNIELKVFVELYSEDGHTVGGFPKS